MTSIDFVLNGERRTLTSADVRTALRGGAPDIIHVHCVEVDGVRWPPLQAIELATGLDRREFNSHAALRHLGRLGFATSPWASTPGTTSRRQVAESLAAPLSDAAAVGEAFARLVEFLGDQALTARIATVERSVLGADADEARGMAAQAGLDSDVLRAALLVRGHVGRINDVIHAATIMQLVPRLLEPGERIVNRPSLGAGNDPSRPFDLETDRRVAEVKVAVWKGSDAMRMRTLFADVVHLVLAEGHRRRQLFVVGPQPQPWLRGGAAVKWALGRSSPNLRAALTERFGPDDMRVRDFMAGPGRNVEVLDLRDWVPELTTGP